MKLVKCLITAGIGVLLAINLSCADNLEKDMDKFYGGLADIVEKNMDNPDYCVKAVDDYYVKNKGTVEKIRKVTEKMMAEAYQATDMYGSMDPGEYEALEEETVERTMIDPKFTGGAQRYSEAMQKFSMKHPRYAMQVGLKAMQLAPNPKSFE